MENIQSTDISLIYDISSRATAEKLVLRCNVRANLKGFDYLVDAVIFSGTGTATRVCEIYSRIGALRNAKSKSVLRSISYAIANAPELPYRLGEMLGITLSASDIHNALVIAYLGKLFGSPSLAALA